MSKKRWFLPLLLLLMLIRCSDEALESKVESKVDPQFWEYSGNRESIKKAISHLQGLPDVEAFQKSLVGKPLWDETLTILLDNAPSMLVPVVNRKRNSIRAIVVMQYDRKKKAITQKTIFRKKLTVEQSEFYSYASWMGLFKALDKEILKKENMSSGFKKAKLDASQQRWVCSYVEWEYCWHTMVCAGEDCYEGEPECTTWIEEEDCFWEPDPEPPGDDEGGGGGDNDYGDYDHGDPGDPSPWADVIINVPIPGDKITNIQDYIKCFNTSASATFTVYVDQPKAGERDTWSGRVDDPNVGHAYIGITQGGTTRIFGYYPDDGVNPCTDVDAPATYVDDSQHSYDVKMSVTISGSNLTNLLNYVGQMSGSTYDLNDYNCTNFVTAAAQAAGILLPLTEGTWPCGSGYNPGDLGEDLRGMSGTDGYPGSAPSNSGTCN